MLMEINDRLLKVLEQCELKDNHLHGRLSLIQNHLWEVLPESELTKLVEIEDLYIQKGVIVCYTSYHIGYDDALKEHPLYIKTNKKERLSSLKIPLLLPTTMTTF
ncbi:hypothetical protein ABNF72_05275 [Paenibacillus larvae]